MSLLNKLPGIEGQKGWPWTEEVHAGIYGAKKQWPKISIVTPSYNQGQFIEETIRSILLQNYPNLEYIIIDGGSSDNTVEILKKYEPWISLWVSEKDSGQANAINKGIKKCSGDIFNWINSDDYLAPIALYNVATTYKKGATVAGRVLNFYNNDPSFKDIVENKGLTASDFISLKSTFHQPGVWCDLNDIKAAGKFPEHSSYYFDRIFFTSYFVRFSKVLYTNNVLVYFRYHEESKTLVIRDSKANELIDYYLTLLAKPLFKPFTKQLRSALKYQLLPEKHISDWEYKNADKRFGTRIASYLGLAFMKPGLLQTRHFFTKFKRSVLHSLN